MATTASAVGRRWPLLGVLGDELAPRPGRLAAVARIVICCTVVVAVSMLYQIPEPAYATYIVFFLGRGDRAVTLLTGIVGALAITLATGLTLTLYMLDAGEPALRLPLMAGSAFVGMFLMRTITLGPVAFLVGFLLVITQSLIDVMPTLEALTRFVLWLWVVVLLPDVVTVLVNLLAGQNPVRLAHDSSRQLLDSLATAIRTDDRTLLSQHRAAALELVELRHHAGMLDRDLRTRNALDASLIETIAELFALASLLPSDTDAETRARLAKACEACRDLLDGNAGARSADHVHVQIPENLEPKALPIVTAMTNALNRLGTGLARRRETHEKAATSGVRAFFVPDAFSNPEHVRFALKTTIAVMVAYITYTLLDWPGIRTALITCFFVALGSLGETIHKLTLRFSGALAGCLLGGLCIVYLLPRMEDIGDLCLLIAAVSALFAWVATSSERIAYAGMQAALAFYLCVLQGYEPTDDLTALRDRIAGLLLGNVLMSAVFSTIWPVSAKKQALAALAGAIRKLSALLLDRGSPESGARLAVAQAMGKARQFVSIALFETGMLPTDETHSAREKETLDAVERLAARVFVVVEQAPSGTITDIYRGDDQVAAAWLSDFADDLAADRTTPLPLLAPTTATSPDHDASPLVRSAFEARVMLRADIEEIAHHAA
jgi:multidrug resistance protein MdtO